MKRTDRIETVISINITVSIKPKPTDIIKSVSEILSNRITDKIISVYGSVFPKYNDDKKLSLSYKFNYPIIKRNLSEPLYLIYTDLSNLSETVDLSIYNIDILYDDDDE